MSPLIITLDNPFYGDSRAFFDKLKAAKPNLAITAEGWEFFDWRQIESRLKIAFQQHNPGPCPAKTLARFIQLKKEDSFGELIISKKLLLEKGLPANKERLLIELWKYWSHFPSQFTILEDT